MAVALAALAVIVAGAVIILGNRDDSKSPSTAKSSGRVTTTSVSPGATTSPSSQSTGTSSSSTTSASAGSTPVTTVPLALPEADQKAPPDPPTGLYRQGKLRLVGSVPSADIAVRYQKRIEGILGRGNVTMAMQRDPRVPASPLRVIVEEEFRFPTGSIAVDPKYTSLLNLGVVALKKLPEARLIVTGYTDNVGAPEVNQSLSEERAQVVVDWMVRGGIPANRIQALGRGAADPLATNTTPEGRLANRRIEATLEGIQP